MNRLRRLTQATANFVTTRRVDNTLCLCTRYLSEHPPVEMKLSLKSKGLRQSSCEFFQLNEGEMCCSMTPDDALVKACEENSIEYLQYLTKTYEMKKDTYDSCWKITKNNNYSRAARNLTTIPYVWNSYVVPIVKRGSPLESVELARFVFLQNWNSREDVRNNILFNAEKNYVDLVKWLFTYAVKAFDDEYVEDILDEIIQVARQRRHDGLLELALSGRLDVLANLRSNPEIKSLFPSRYRRLEDGRHKELINLLRSFRRETNREISNISFNVLIIILMLSMVVLSTTSRS